MNKEQDFGFRQAGMEKISELLVRDGFTIGSNAEKHKEKRSRLDTELWESSAQRRELKACMWVIKNKAQKMKSRLFHNRDVIITIIECFIDYHFQLTYIKWNYNSNLGLYLFLKSIFFPG